MTEWKEVRFNDVIDLNPTVRLKREIEYPFIGIADINENNFYVNERETKKFTGQSGSKFISGDTLFSRITPCLENRKIAQSILKSKDKGFGSTELLVFRAKEGKSDPSYINYLAQTDIIVLPAINSMSGASGRQRADSKFIKKLKINVPCLNTQKKIANALSTYDKLIENNNRRIEILEQTAEEIYKEWFVRMRFPGYEYTKFDKGIPKNWKTVKLENLCTLVRGISYRTKDIENNQGTPMMTLKSVQSYGGYSNEGIRYYDNKISDRHILRENDILMAITDMTQDKRIIGQVLLVPNISNEQVVYSADLILLDELQIEAGYFYSMLRFGGLSNHIAMYSNGANVLHLNQRTLNKINVLVAPKKLRKAYNDLFQYIQKEINILETKSNNLIKQRDLLLPRLMNGTIEVK